MSFLFISNLPKEESIESIQAFLEVSFPLNTSIRILRSGQGHKGHAYVHFANEKVAQTAAELCTVARADSLDKVVSTPFVYSDGRTELRLRVCGARERPESEESGEATRYLSLDPSSTPSSLIMVIEGMPLPPHCAEIAPYKRCRYALTSSFDEERNKKYFSKMSPISTVGEDILSKKVCVAVLHGIGDERLEMDGSRDVLLARCGPPSLTAMLSPGCGLSEQLHFSELWDVGKDQPRKLRRVAGRKEVGAIENESQECLWRSESVSPQQLESASGLRCTRGCSWLSPSEVLDELRTFFDGKGRVAIKDRFGAIAVIKLPAYVASME